MKIMSHTNHQITTGILFDSESPNCLREPVILKIKTIGGIENPSPVLKVQELLYDYEEWLILKHPLSNSIFLDFSNCDPLLVLMLKEHRVVGDFFIHGNSQGAHQQIVYADRIVILPRYYLLSWLEEKKQVPERTKYSSINLSVDYDFLDGKENDFWSTEIIAEIPVQKPIFKRFMPVISPIHKEVVCFSFVIDGDLYAYSLKKEEWLSGNKTFYEEPFDPKACAEDRRVNLYWQALIRL